MSRPRFLALVCYRLAMVLPVEMSCTRLIRTHEFVGQHNADIFRSIEVKAMFQY